MLIIMSNTANTANGGVNNMSISDSMVINIFTGKSLSKVINILCTA